VRGTTRHRLGVVDDVIDPAASPPGEQRY
jgi:hypothetical protein